MKIKPIKNISYTVKKDPSIIRLVNALAKSTGRLPSDALRKFIVEQLPIYLQQINEGSDKPEHGGSSNFSSSSSIKAPEYKSGGSF